MTGSSNVLDALRTNSPPPASIFINGRDSIPSAFAGSSMRTFAMTDLLVRSARRPPSIDVVEAEGPTAPGL